MQDARGGPQPVSRELLPPYEVIREAPRAGPTRFTSTLAVLGGASAGGTQCPFRCFPIDAFAASQAVSAFNGNPRHSVRWACQPQVFGSDGHRGLPVAPPFDQTPAQRLKRSCFSPSPARMARAP